MVGVGVGVGVGVAVGVVVVVGVGVAVGVAVGVGVGVALNINGDNQVKASSRKAAVTAANKKVKERHKGEPKSARAKTTDKVAKVEKKKAAVVEGKATGAALGEFAPDSEVRTEADAAAWGASLMEAAAGSMPEPKAPKAPRAPRAPKAPRTDGLPELPALPGEAKTRTARERKPKEMHPCACGCGTPCKATWAPGHDARAKGWALRIERGILTIDQVPENEQQGANRMLVERATKAAEAPTTESVLKLVSKAESAAVNE